MNIAAPPLLKRAAYSASRASWAAPLRLRKLFLKAKTIEAPAIGRADGE
jgi:hypothetical protein